MKRLIAVAVFAGSVLFASGCNVYNAPACPGACPMTADGHRIDSAQAAATQQSGRTVININAPAQPPAPQAMMLQTGYQTVYTTEYGPVGPMVKKAMVPVYSTAPTPQAVLMPVPSATGMPCAPIILQQNINPGAAVSPAFPPAQSAQPAVKTDNAPIAWYGPTASVDGYRSTQTAWF